MRISERWLKELVEPNLATAALAELLTMAGLEVDAIEPAAGEFSGVVVGRVESTRAHPDANKLTLCKVDVGQAELLDIVCGATNVRQGLVVAVAMVGAKLPGGLKITKAKLRGEISLGMLCSASELGLAESSNGIIELPQDAPIGHDLRELLNCDDAIIEIDLTPNRGDCLSIRGLAREVAALTDVKWTEPSNEVVVLESETTIKAHIAAPSYCAQYLCRYVSTIDPSAKVPLWMSEKLRRSGLRSHSLAVDITNFVMMELGQPMHAFDADKIVGSISIRLSTEGESLTLLDEQMVTLIPGTLVIADSEKVLAIAGVMGGLDSCVTSTTTNILFESAYFVPEKIAGVARSYGLATDSSHRFERGVAPELQLKAIERATSLLQQFAGGLAGPITMSSEVDYLPSDKQIFLSIHQANKLLGTSFTKQEIQSYLERLGMQVEEAAESQLAVNVPAFRFDISIAEDLVEELARVHGYNNIPTSSIVAEFKAHKSPEQAMNAEVFRQMLADLGYFEAISYSFVCPKKQALIYDKGETTDLVNPISADLSQMRQGLMVGLLTAYASNLSRQVQTQKMFEIGLCFEKHNGELKQINRVAGLLAGFDGEHDWSKTKRAYDFFDMKGDVEQLLNASIGQVSFEPCMQRAFHPGKSAMIKKDGLVIGYIGELHPSVAKGLSLSKTPFLFELDLAPMLEKPLPAYQKLSKYPSISRDLSLVMDENRTFYEVAQCIQAVKHEVPLVGLSLFDVYHGDNIERGKKSMAIGFQLQHLSRTLVDEEVNDYMAAILHSLEQELSITLRD